MALAVDGAPVTDRHVLESGEVVTLLQDEGNELLDDDAAGGQPPSTRAAAPATRARMCFALEHLPCLEAGSHRTGTCEWVTAGCELPDELGDAAVHGDSGPSFAFLRYYEMQRLASPREWADALALLRKPMPLCLRVNTSAETEPRAIEPFLHLFGDRLHKLGWTRSAWQLQFDGAVPSRRSLGGMSSPPPDEAAVAEALILGQATGAIAQQEAAAMLPALALAPRRHHFVLDMCAAPGGKTLQMLDMMMSDDEAEGCAVRHQQPPRGETEGAAPAQAVGILISNDIEAKRQERTLRRAYNQPCEPLLVTACDAARFPELYAIPNPAGAGAALRYDRILCDVPCSGDGTVRKSPDKWSRWRARAGLAQHPTQLAILLRGLSLLKPGGRLAYSTCSLDPLQGEAVVAAALAQVAPLPWDADASEHAAEFGLLKPNDVLPVGEASCGLRLLPGLTTWCVPHPSWNGPSSTSSVDCGQQAQGRASAPAPAKGFFSTWDEVPIDLRETAGGLSGGWDVGGMPRIHRTMFPPKPSMDVTKTVGDFNARAHVLGHCLTRCMRVLPSSGGMSGCGGFFVAVIERRCRGSTMQDASGAEGGKGQNGRSSQAQGASQVFGNDADSAHGLDLEGRRLWNRAPAALCTELERFFGLGRELNEGVEGARNSITARLVTSALSKRGQPLLLSLVPSAALDLVQPNSSLSVAASLGTGANGSGSSRRACQSHNLSSGALTALGCGVPLFAWMPPSMRWWPTSAPWRICNEGASVLACGATRRILRVRNASAAHRILAARSIPVGQLVEMARRGELCGLLTCCLPEDVSDGGLDRSIGLDGMPLQLVAGALVITLPCVDSMDERPDGRDETASKATRAPRVGAISGVFVSDDGSGGQVTDLLLLTGADVLQRWRGEFQSL